MPISNSALALRSRAYVCPGTEPLVAVLGFSLVCIYRIGGRPEPGCCSRKPSCAHHQLDQKAFAESIIWITAQHAPMSLRSPIRRKLESFVGPFLRRNMNPNGGLQVWWRPWFVQKGRLWRPGAP
eukprot:6939262-Pyramimonas_sp.AAC.1